MPLLRLVGKLPKIIISKRSRKDTSAIGGRDGSINLIDVGSAGRLPSPWDENSRKIQNLLKFEPRGEVEKNEHIVSVDAALWSTDCQRDFYIYKGRSGTGSSLYEQNYAYVKENFADLKKRGPRHLAETWFERSKLAGVEKINCRTLDNILNELDRPFGYHFLKIDAQGAEYEILQGAETFLGESCLGLHLELFTIPIYKGIKLKKEVVAYLQDFGFEMVKEYPAHGTFDSQNDCIFLKRDMSNQVIKTIKKFYGQ